MYTLCNYVLWGNEESESNEKFGFCQNTQDSKLKHGYQCFYLDRQNSEQIFSRYAFDKATMDGVVEQDNGVTGWLSG